jgi:hypothetical protein
VTWHDFTMRWKADMASDELELTWQRVGELIADTWHHSDKLGGATWPNHGLPRGTFVYGVV